MAIPEISDGLVLFGGGGDLSLRMLFPSLAYLEADGLLPADLPIIAVARSPMDEDAFRKLVRESLAARWPDTLAGGAADRMLARTRYVAADVTHPEELKRVGAMMAELNIVRPLYYLSVSPSLYSAICQGLLAAGLTSGPARRRWQRTAQGWM